MTPCLDVVDIDLEELRNIIAKAQSKNDERYYSLASDLEQTKHDLTARLIGIATELARSQKDITTAKLEIADLKHGLMKAHKQIEGLQKQAAQSKSEAARVKKEIAGKKYATGLMGSDQPDTNRSVVSMYDHYGNIKWQKVGEVKDGPVTQSVLSDMRKMHEIGHYPDTLRLQNTGLDFSLAGDIAEFINEHPSGFKEIIFWDEPKLGNKGLKAIVDGIVDRLNVKALRNIRSIELTGCGLTGQLGGQAIHSLLEKCGNSLHQLLFEETLGKDGWAVAFGPMKHDRIYDLSELHIGDHTVTKKQVQDIHMRNFKVRGLQVYQQQ
eukprot:Platyproteum_vivax@DN5396_c0_g1_i1.p1